MVLAVAGEVTGSVVAAQEPLMEAGMDSLSVPGPRSLVWVKFTNLGICK